LSAGTREPEREHGEHGCVEKSKDVEDGQHWYGPVGESHIVHGRNQFDRGCRRKKISTFPMAKIFFEGLTDLMAWSRVVPLPAPPVGEGAAGSASGPQARRFLALDSGPGAEAAGARCASGQNGPDRRQRRHVLEMDAEVVILSCGPT
jgi:hypothetical protein